MKIAQIAPLMESVPPRLYGGTERIVSWLTEELVNQGHDVTLFASGDSMTAANLVPCTLEAIRLSETMKDYMPHYTMMVDRVRRLTQAFDILHFHIDMFHFPLFRGLENRTLTTLHGRQDLPDLFPFYQAFPKMPLVSISDSPARADRGREFRRHGAARTAGRSARAELRAARAATSPSSGGSRPRSVPTAPSRSPGRWAFR